MWELVVNKRDEEESQQCVTEIDQFSPPAPKRRQLQQKPEFLKRTISILQPTDQHDENRRTKFLRRKTICLPYFPYMDILLCILLYIVVAYKVELENPPTKMSFVFLC